MQFYRYGSGKAEWYRSTVNIAHYRTILRQIKKFGFNFRQGRKKELLNQQRPKRTIKVYENDEWKKCRLLE